MRLVSFIFLYICTSLLSLVFSAEPAWEWTPTGISGGGAMYAPAISPVDSKCMFVPCDMSGGYVTSNGGESWQMINHAELTPSTRFQAAYHPTEKNTLYAANGWSGRVLKFSKDGGKSWKELAKLPEPLTGGLFIDRYDTKNFALGSGKNTCLSNDGGITWRTVEGVSGNFIGFDFGKDKTYFAATSEGVFRSKDAGKNWSKTVSGLSEGALLSFAVGVNKDGTKRILYAAMQTGVENGKLTGGIFCSENSGESWISAMGEGINKETKAFDQWSEGNFPVYKYVLAAEGNPQVVYVLNSSTGVPPPHHATVFRSDNAGKTWQAVFNPDPRWAPHNVEKDYTVIEDGQYYGGLSNGVAISPSDASTLIKVDNGCAYVTFDGGESWKAAHTKIASSEEEELSRWYCNGLVVTSAWNYKIDPFDSKNHFICYTDIGFATSKDSGESWSWWSKRGRAPWRNTCYNIAFDPEIKGKIWGAFSNVHDIPCGNIIENRHRSSGPGGICLSDDGGSTWKAYKDNGIPVAPATDIVVDPKSPKGKRTLYAGFFEKGVYRSDDDGETWQAKNEGLGAPGNMRVSRVILHSDGTLFAVVTALMAKNRVFQKGGAGVYTSSDKGEHWSCISAEQSFLWPKDLTVDPKDSNVLYLGNCNANRKDSSGLYMTKDKGKTWKRIAKQGPEHMGAYLHPARPGRLFMTVSEGAPEHGLWLSRDSGETFSPIKEFPFRNALRVVADPSDPKIIYVTTFGGSVWKGKER